MSISTAEMAKILALASGAVLPVGTVGTPFAQTFDRRLANGAVFAPTSGTMYMTGIWLPQGVVINGINWVSSSTGETGGTHLWSAVYSSALALLGQSADNTGATAFAANTAFRQAMQTPVTIPSSGLYYLAFMCSQSAGGTPTLVNALLPTNANANGGITGMTPILAATSSTGLAGTPPNPAGALTAIVHALYAFVD